ncbi:MAG: Maltodextrin ABC transporter, permease protein MdxF, partial [uncultured Solirubrobacteraceae bacterium]
EHLRPAAGRRGRDEAEEGRADRAGAGRAQARLDAVRAGRRDDAAGHGVSDHLRDHPVGPRGRSALPGRGRLRRDRQLRHRADLAAVVGGAVQHDVHHRRVGRHRARARHDPRARHAPRDLRPRPHPHVGPDPVRDHHRGGVVRVVLRVLARLGLRQRPAVHRRRQGVVRRAVQLVLRDHRRRGVEDHAVHGPAAARRSDHDRRGPLRGGEGRRRERLAALHADHAAADEAGDPRRAAVPHARRLPRLRLDLRDDPWRGGHGVRVDRGLRPAHIPAQPRPRLGRVGPHLPDRPDDRVPVRARLRRRRPRKGRRL